MAAPLFTQTPQTQTRSLRRRIDRLERRPPANVGKFEIKVFADATVVTTGSNLMTMCIPDDLNGTQLVTAAAFVSTAGSVTLQVRNVTLGGNMLSTALTIDAGKTTSYASAVPAVISTANALVATGHLITIDVSAAGGAAKGLGVMLMFA